MYRASTRPSLIGDRLQGGDDDGGVGEEVVIGADDDVELGAADEGALELARRRQRDALVQVTVCACQDGQRSCDARQMRSACVTSV